MSIVSLRRFQTKGRTPTLASLPPLSALRAFVVTARHLSFTAAGPELCVTPAAVGQQIRQLEAHLGRALFVRKGRQLELTAAGSEILPVLASAFEQMVEAVAHLLDNDQSPLSISVAPSFASKWLIPRLDRFRSAYADLDIKIDASAELTDFATGETDCAIRFGSGAYENLIVEKLFAEAVFPVASPALLAGRHPLRRPDDLRHHVLLHDDSAEDDSGCPDWSGWLRAAGLSLAAPGIRFNRSALVLEAAIAGQGVALAKARLAGDDLRGGRLVRPFGEAQALNLSYFLVAPHHKLRLPRVRAFRDWLVREASGEDPVTLLRDQQPRLAVG